MCESIVISKLTIKPKYKGGERSYTVSERTFTGAITRAKSGFSASYPIFHVFELSSSLTKRKYYTVLTFFLVVLLISIYTSNRRGRF